MAEMDEGYDEYLDGDPRSLDNRTPSNTPLPQVEGGPHAAAATGTEFEVNAMWRMPRHPTYEHPLCRFMAFVHNQPFERDPKGTTFSQEQLLQIKPEHVYNWLGKLAFRKVDFSIDAGDRPTKMRCSSLEMRKKQLSFFMPNHAPAWCEGRGNPTKHTMHTTLFQSIKKTGGSRPGCGRQSKTGPHHSGILQTAGDASCCWT